MEKRIAIRVALACFLTGAVIWVPNVVFDYGVSLILLVPVLGLAGVAFALMAKHVWLVIGNLAVADALFLVFAIGHLMAGGLV